MNYWMNRVVLITGAASGIGQATAVRFSHEGAYVGLLDRDATGLQHTLDLIRDSSCAMTLPADLVDEQSVVDAVARLASWKSRIDVVVNVAGICPAEEYLEAPRSH